MNLFPVIISLSIALSIGLYYLKDAPDRSQVIEYRAAMLNIEQIANTFSESLQYDRGQGSTNTDEALSCEDNDLYPEDVYFPPDTRWRIDISGLDCDIAKLSFGVSQDKFSSLIQAAVESSTTLGEIDNNFSEIHWVYRLHTRRVDDGGVEGALQDNQYGSCFRCIHEGISIKKQSGDMQSAKVGQTVDINPQVKVFLNDGNETGIAGVKVYFYPSGNSTVNSLVETTDTNGLASTQWTVGTQAGNYSLNVQPRGVSFSNVVFTADAIFGDPYAMQAIDWQAGQSGTVGELFGLRPAVKVVDQYDHPIPGESINFAINQGGGSLGEDNNQIITVTTNSDGIASVGWTLGQIAGTNQLTATHSSLGDLSFIVEGIAGVPAQLDLMKQPIADPVSGETMTQQPVVIIKDRFGNLTQSNADIAVAIGSNPDNKGRLDGQVSVNAINGRATFAGLNFEGRIGTFYTLQFASAGLTSVTSNPISVIHPGDPTTLTASSSHSSGAVVASNVSATVTLTDRPGNPIPNQTVVFTVNAGNGSVTTPASTTDSQGVASADWNLGTQVDTNILEAKVDGCCSAILSIETYAEPPAKLAMIQAPVPGVKSGDTFQTQPILQILDRFDNVIYDDQYYLTVSIHEGDYNKVRLTSLSELQARNVNGIVEFNDLAVKAEVGYEFKLKFQILDHLGGPVYYSDVLTIQNAGEPYTLFNVGYLTRNHVVLVFNEVRDDMENLVIGTPVYFLTLDGNVRTDVDDPAGTYSNEAATESREVTYNWRNYTWGPVLAVGLWKLKQGKNILRISLCEDYYDINCSIANRRLVVFTYTVY